MKTVLSLSVAGVLAGSEALADSIASSWTDLNLRSGAGRRYPVVGVIAADKLVYIVR